MSLLAKMSQPDQDLFLPTEAKRLIFHRVKQIFHCAFCVIGCLVKGKPLRESSGTAVSGCRMDLDKGHWKSAMHDSVKCLKEASHEASHYPSPVDKQPLLHSYIFNFLSNIKHPLLAVLSYQLLGIPVIKLLCSLQWHQESLRDLDLDLERRYMLLKRTYPSLLQPLIVKIIARTPCHSV